LGKGVQPGLDFVVFRGQIHEAGIIHDFDTVDQTVLAEAAGLEVRAEDVERHLAETGFDQ